jgi:hypothetical protein
VFFKKSRTNQTINDSICNLPVCITPNSFLAECAGVLASLLHLKNIQTNCRRVCLFLDNRAVCWALISESPCTLIQKCRLAFRRLWNYDFHIFWIPSHVGIPENEFVDQRAHSCVSDANGVAFSLDMEMYILKRIIRDRVYDRWQRKWNTSVSRYKHIRPFVNKFYMLVSIPRSLVILPSC